MRALVLLLWLTLVLASPSGARAHAVLERSAPASGSVVPTSPRSIQLWFSERPALQLSEVALYAADSSRLPRGPLAIPDEDPRSLVFAVDDLPAGVYTVFWRTLSRDDLHPSAGAFAFAVGTGQPPPTADDIVVPSQRAAASGLPSPLAVLAHWSSYAGAALVGGGVLFLSLVLWPSLRRSGGATDRPGLGEVSVARLNQLYRAGLWLLLGGAVVGLLAQAVLLSGDDSAALRGALLELLATQRGLLFWARLLALAALVPAVRRLGQQGWVVVPGRPIWPLLVLLVASAALLMAHALGSHAQLSPPPTTLAVALHWLHLGAMAAYLGGLAMLVLLMPLALAERSPPARAELWSAVLTRFSTLAAICVGLLVLTGLYQTWAQVGAPPALTAAPYGLALLLKLAIVAPLLLLGARHLRAVRARRLAHARLALRPALVLGALVLLATAMLANLSPARTTLVEITHLPPVPVEITRLPDRSPWTSLSP